jgi:hypothetical protein
LTLKLEKVIFLFEHPIELDTEDRVMKRNTNRVMKYDLILQGAMSLMHRRKSGMGDREAFLVQRFSCPSCYTINASFIVSCAPSIINLEMRFLLRGEGYNTPYYDYPNYCHYNLNHASNLWFNQIEIEIQDIQFHFNSKHSRPSQKFLVWHFKLFSKCWVGH